MDRGKEKFEGRSANSSSHVADQGDGRQSAKAFLDECEKLLEICVLLWNNILANFDAWQGTNHLSQMGINLPELRKKQVEESVVRYAKIAAMLPDKSIRDVALHRRWMMNELEKGLSETEHQLLDIKKQISELPEPLKSMFPPDLFPDRELDRARTCTSFIQSSM